LKKRPQKIGPIRLGITGKMLGFVLPLVVLPCLATGVLGYFASEEIVTRLLNQSQINMAREIAEQIDRDFKTCRADLELISHLPVLTDYYYNRLYSLESEAEVNRKQVEGFFRDLSRKSTLYNQISYMDSGGKKVACVTGGEIIPPSDGPSSHRFFKPGKQFSPDVTVISPVQTSDGGSKLIVHLAKPLFDKWNDFVGLVIIDLDIMELGRRILSRKVGINGYVFVLDNAGRVLIHPEERHLGRMPHELGEPSVEAMIQTMLQTGQGMIPYYYHGDKIAAFTGVREEGWIVAVSLSVAEFKAHVTVIKKQVLHIIFIAASLALAGGIFFSWYFLRPLKKLAKATDVITEGRLPEKIKFESKDEIGNLTRSFNQMVKNLRRVQDELVKSEKLVSMGRLASGVAHEVRNPLNTMNVTVGLLKRRIAEKPEVLELAETISAEISRLDHFISEFLSYSRQPPPKPTPTDVNEMVDEILSGHSAMAQGNRVVFKKRLDPSLPPFYLDPFQVERALINIVVNAIEAMPEGGELVVSTEWHPSTDGKSNGDYLALSVADTGKGMSSEELHSVYDPFYTTKVLGTGLGLSLSQSIIESHGGTIQIKSIVDWGTTITVKLPRDIPPVYEEVDREQVQNING
jgi:two-component system NtrC family sensor kinase